MVTGSLYHVERRGKIGHRLEYPDDINPLTPGAFCKKMHLQHDSLPLLPPASRFTTFWLARAQKSKFLLFFSFCCSD